jgi:poly-gamma-glutamate synthesis protein (capsule biosynthesis protein)
MPDTKRERRCISVRQISIILLLLHPALSYSDPSSANPPASSVTLPNFNTDIADAQRNDISILFAGDTHFEWEIRSMQRERGVDYPFELMKDFFQNFDLRVLNLETTISSGGTPINSKSYIFNAPPTSVAALSTLGVDIVGLGNNHSMDMGSEAMSETISHLRNHGISSIGAGRDADEALAPLIIEIKGLSIGFIACTNTGPAEQYAKSGSPGVASCGSNIFRKLSELKKSLDHVIVTIHWGTEYSPLPDSSQIGLARNFIKYGASAVIGHHPHIPQGIEMSRGGVIVYSLGNFLFGSIQSQQRDNMLVSLHFNRKTKSLHSVRIYPVNGEYRRRGNRVFLLKNGADDFWKRFYVQSTLLNSKKPWLQLRHDGTGEWLIERD